MSPATLMDLIQSLAKLPTETEWLEFKTSDNSAERIGEDISALANAAAYHGRDCGYKIWGVENNTHELIGTAFDPQAATAKGNQPLLIWLRNMLSDNASYQFDIVEDDGLAFVVLTVQAAVGQPVYYQKMPYIREGSSTTLLRSSSAKERELWHRLDRSDFLHQAAQADLTQHDALSLLDVDAFFSLLGMSQPSSDDAAAAILLEQGLLRRQDNDMFSVTNFGLLLVGKSLSSYFGMRKRALRIVRFNGTGNTEIAADKTFDKGYALALPEAEEFIMNSIPSKEVLDGAFRRLEYEYPRAAVRELLSNSVVHQDLTQSTSGPLVGIYSNRLEFSNPGASLIANERVLNSPPKTRNPELAGMLRQMDFCEEGGTGWDIAVEACEQQHLPAPKMLSDDISGTHVTLYGGRAYDRMTKKERIDALYWHACLMYARGSSMGNQSLRARYGLNGDKKNVVAVSRLIRNACDLGLIREEDSLAGNRSMRYIPAWA